MASAITRQSECAEIAELKLVDEVPAALVFDHLGCVRGSATLDAAGFSGAAAYPAATRRLLGEDFELVSPLAIRSAPIMRICVPFAHALVDARPDRAVFGTNWPHPNQFTPEVNPNDGDLIDSFCTGFPTRRRVNAYW